MQQIKFAANLIQWYQQYGRHDLPWQKNKTSYRVWISEIMLQQTQVNTVIPYYLRFMKRFPNLKSLAIASEDDVLAYWSGLGYYARARNLHRTAKIIFHDYHGRFPTTIDELTSLSGIGRSTAGAILSFSMKKFAVILDGNVKRILTRYYAINEPINQTRTLSKLWLLAAELTPVKNAHQYNQAIMDIGAIICTHTQPKCLFCPLSNDCLAFQNNTVPQYPLKMRQKIRPIKKIFFMIIENSKHQILLLKRPSTGIWGGLWSFPEYNGKESDYVLWENTYKNCRLKIIEKLSILTHSFTHFTLEITPIRFRINRLIQPDDQQFFWYKLSSELPGGVAAPVSKLLKLVNSW